MLHSMGEVIEFMEQLEAAEDFDPTATKIPKKSDKKDKKSSSNSKPNSGTKHCIHHGPGNHNSDECEHLKRLVAQENGDSKPPHKNKTWKRDPKSSSSKDSKKELASFIKKTIRAEMHSFAKKRKRSSDEEEGEVNNIDLAEFNYSNINMDLDNLQIESGDEASV